MSGMVGLNYIEVSILASITFTMHPQPFCLFPGCSNFGISNFTSSHLTRELDKLRPYLPDGVVLCTGGQAADAYQETLNAIGAAHIRDITGFLSELAAL